MIFGLLREFDPYVTDWTVFKSQLENFFFANNISNDNFKRAIFLNTVNQESFKLLLTLCHPLKPEITPFSKILSLFDHQFADPLFLRRFEFFNARRDQEESLDKWIERVKSLARACAFDGLELDKYSKEVFLSGLNNSSFFQLFENIADATFEEFVEVVRKNIVMNDEGTEDCSRYYNQELCYNQFYAGLCPGPIYFSYGAMERFCVNPYHYQQ
ncbi:unnamed protein product [Phaedon cochleariae]|uniref:Uncharacterized protein n=1 Tax=Phaedon cochleariae TaxID=80249 RepID=A0A9N9SCW2_PHACE|nr:unnamed protein product [Phaedon cochleariae]